MSTLTKICFDASIHDNTVGIGIFNFDSKERITHRYKNDTKSSAVAESMALIKTIHYLRRRKIKSAHLFTDNKSLAEKGISKKIASEFKNITLTWIPREFNTDADELSKESHKMIAQAMDKPVNSKEYKPITRLRISKRANIKKQMKKYTFEQKITLLNRFSVNEICDSYIKEIIRSSDKHIHISAVRGLPKKEFKFFRRFLRIMKTLFTEYKFTNDKTFNGKTNGLSIMGDDALHSNFENLMKEI